MSIEGIDPHSGTILLLQLVGQPFPSRQTVLSPHKRKLWKTGLEERTLEDKTLEERTLEERILEDKTLEEMTLEETTLEQRTGELFWALVFD